MNTAAKSLLLVAITTVVFFGCPTTGANPDGGSEDTEKNVQTCSGAVDFPDPALQAAIRDVIQQPTGDILSQDLQQVNHVDFGDRGISDITGIECLTALESLHLYMNQIVDINSIKNLVELKYVDLDDNLIVDIGPVSGLVAIERLTLMNDGVVDIGPLVENQGIDLNDYIMLIGNPLDCSAQANNITELESRGVQLHTECP